MNIRDYEYIVAVSELLHFGKAARFCKISQPTLSMQIKKFEDIYDVKIFDRSNKKIVITEIGEQIVAKAKSILENHKLIEEITTKTKDPETCELKLAVFPTLGPYILPKIIPKIHSRYPNLQLLLIEEKTDTILPKLIDSKIDCALLALPIDNDSLEYQPLFFDRFNVALPSQHPLAKRKNIALNDLANERILLLEEGHCLRSQALEVCSLVKKSTYQEFQATSLETLRYMIGSGSGVTLIPHIASIKTEGVTYVPCRDRKLGRSIALVYKKDSHRKASIDLIYKKMINIFAGEVEGL